MRAALISLLGWYTVSVHFLFGPGFDLSASHNALVIPVQILQRSLALDENFAQFSGFVEPPGFKEHRAQHDAN
eukprot:m.468144 g.468144  ORF g.468144 m.468144 type:complete len:73 (-) comp27217_c0_seq1:1249-1467(-)